jgi:hypothetical protein
MRDANGAWHLEDVAGGVEGWTIPDIVLDAAGSPAIVASAFVGGTVALVLLTRE